MGEHEDFKPDPRHIAAAGKHFAAAAVFSAMAKVVQAREELDLAWRALEDLRGGH